MHSTQSGIDGGKRRTTTWRTRNLNPRKLLDRTRAIGLSVLLKAALHLGFVIVLIGRCRSGKTYLLERFLAGKIIDHSDMWKESPEHRLFSLKKVPNGPFAIDEMVAFEPGSLFEGVMALAQGGRKFAIAAQCPRDLDEANIGRALQGRRVLVVYLEPSTNETMRRRSIHRFRE